MIYIAADHAGFKLKQNIIKKMKNLVDLMPKFKKGDDYPLIAKKLCNTLKKTDKGILICGSGIGVSIAANKCKGIRAALCHSVNDAKNSRNDENANVLCLSGWSLTTDKALKIIKKWLSTPFNSALRHKRRIKQITDIEKWR